MAFGVSSERSCSSDLSTFADLPMLRAISGSLEAPKTMMRMTMRTMMCVGRWAGLSYVVGGLFGGGGDVDSSEAGEGAGVSGGRVGERSAIQASISSRTASRIMRRGSS